MIVATEQNATTIQPYIDNVVMVSKTRTISEFTTLRHEMRAMADRVPVGV